MVSERGTLCDTFGYISAFPSSEFTYVVHLEAINCLLVLLSVQLFSQTAAEYSTVYRIAMHAHSSCCSQHAPAVVCTLLHNFVQREHAPPGLLAQQPGAGIVFSIAGKPTYPTISRRALPSSPCFPLQSGIRLISTSARLFSWSLERHQDGYG